MMVTGVATRRDWRARGLRARHPYMTDEALEYIDRLVKEKVALLGDDEEYSLHANSREMREHFKSLPTLYRGMLLSYYFTLHREHLLCITHGHNGGRRYHIGKRGMV